MSYAYAKQGTGPLRPDVDHVEGTVKAVVGPVYDRYHAVPLDLLKFLDRKKCTNRVHFVRNLITEVAGFSLDREKKLGKVIVPDKWKEGASNTFEGGGRKINENKLLSKKSRWTPYGNTKCIICKQQVHQDGKYCHTCAYSKGVCAMCGKQVLDTKLYKQSNV
ncbi:cysteine-rich PDZ-binding protein-like [Triticum dicoccoides]|uniref:cysteine-rich PDZ-binding protein-like n=1 Tax=Triticum dicoccoides TaxID=85692 RepID=UPI00189117C4|nr:cysteine-rich PDZ-binding protein-like [Triticum dicoccoides]